ncbi:MAG: DUF5069 domain-containing protein [Verrucomicrobiota bacterium]
MSDEEPLGPTGVILRDLPSPYEPHPCGLLHLPRFIAKIRKHLADGLPKSYHKNFCRGFDRFLCLHLGIEPQQVIDAVQDAGEDQEKLDQLLMEIFPDDLRVADWNREVTHKGRTEAGREFLAESLTNMGCPDMIGTIDCVCDMIDFDEGKIPGYDPAKAATES